MSFSLFVDFVVLFSDASSFWESFLFCSFGGRVFRGEEAGGLVSKLISEFTGILGVFMV